LKLKNAGFHDVRTVISSFTAGNQAAPNQGGQKNQPLK
jgi:hypothetical protein